MKRIKAACLEQIIHFSPKDGETSEYAKQAVRNEYNAYKTSMDKRGTKYRILNETVQDDGTIIVHVKRQNNDQQIGDFLK